MSLSYPPVTSFYFELPRYEPSYRWDGGIYTGPRIKINENNYFFMKKYLKKLNDSSKKPPSNS